MVRICLCANRALTANAVKFFSQLQPELSGIHLTLFSVSLRARRRIKSIFKRLVLLSYESDAAKIYRRRKSLSAERLHLHKMSLSATITHVRRARITFFCKRGCKTNAPGIIDSTRFFHQESEWVHLKSHLAVDSNLYANGLPFLFDQGKIAVDAVLNHWQSSSLKTGIISPSAPLSTWHIRNN